MRIRLPLPSGFSFDAVVRSHGWYDLPPFSYDKSLGTLVVAVASRGRAEVVTFRASVGRLEARSESLSPGALRRVARRVFSLDLDFETAFEWFSDRPEFLRALARGGGRMLRAPTLFEDAVKVLLTTNCSWEATRGMVARLIGMAGAAGRAFPGPADVASFSSAVLRREMRCGYRAPSLARFARRVASGRLNLSEWERLDRPCEQIRDEILVERGFGPYAAESLLRIVGRHEFLALDSWVRKKYRQLYPGPARSTDRAIPQRYNKYGPYRGLALWLDMTRDWHEVKAAQPR